MLSIIAVLDVFTGEYENIKGNILISGEGGC